MARKAKAWQPPTRCAVLTANLASYQLYLNAYKGGTYLKHPADGTLDPAYRDGTTLANSNRAHSKHAIAANSYLRPLPKERLEEYQERLRRCYYINYCQETIRVYVSTLFREGYSIERQDVLEKLGDSIAKNIDRLGRDVQAFLREVFEGALKLGWVGVITDRPAAPEAGFESAEEEQAADMRPYSRVVLPLQVWDWRLGEDGDWTFLLLEEAPERVIDPKTAETSYEPRWKVWTRNIWAVIDVDGKELRRGEHGLSRIPFDLFICDPASPDVDDEPFGHSALRDVADLNLEIFQQSSLTEDLARKTNYPTLTLEGNPAEIQRARDGAKSPDGAGPELGAGYMLVAPAKAAWIAPPDTCIRAGRDYIAGIVLELRRIAGIATRSEESVEAHSGAALQWEYSTRYDLVKLRAENLRDGEVRLWRTYADYLKRDIQADTVKYPTSYATAPVARDLEELERMREGGLPAAVLIAQMRSVVLKRYSHLPELQKLLEAVDRVIPAPAADGAPESTTGADAAGAADEAKRAELEFRARMLESLVKARAPQPVGRALLRSIVTALGIASPEVTASIDEAILEWYTTPPDAVGDLAALQGEDVPGETPKRPPPVPPPFMPPRPPAPPEDGERAAS
jgi:hypothetical protein